jgi:hypothetical protein
MAFGLLQKSFAYVEISFSSKKNEKNYGQGELTTRLGGYLDRRWWMRLLSCGFCKKYVAGVAPRLQ